jgi:hypothetical protein
VCTVRTARRDADALNGRLWWVPLVLSITYSESDDLLRMVAVMGRNTFLSLDDMVRCKPTELEG